MPHGRPKDPTSELGKLRQWALDALNRHYAAGTWPTSNRHLFYEAVMDGMISKTPKERPAGVKGRRPDQDLIRATTQLREEGLVPWEWMEDRTRTLSDHRGWPTIAEAVIATLELTYLDPWIDVQPVLVVESESAAGTLWRVASEWRVPIVPIRGQTNGWLRTTVKTGLEGRPVTVFYVGDFDKAGGDIETNAERVLRDVLDVADWKRVALTREQVDEHGLTTLLRPDGRDGKTYGAVEVEALPQQVLDQVVDAAFAATPHNEVRERETAEREAILARLTEPM